MPAARRPRRRRAGRRADPRTVRRSGARPGSGSRLQTIRTDVGHAARGLDGRETVPWIAPQGIDNLGAGHQRRVAREARHCPGQSDALRVSRGHGPVGERVCRTIRTETPECTSTFRATLPRSHRSRPRRQREPVTMRSTRCSAAAVDDLVRRVPGPNLRSGRDPVLGEPCGHRRGVPLVECPQFLAVRLERQAAHRVQADHQCEPRAN